jgi:hypothetical protein
VKHGKPVVIGRGRVMRSLYPKAGKSWVQLDDPWVSVNAQFRPEYSAWIAPRVPSGPGKLVWIPDAASKRGAAGEGQGKGVRP